MMTAVFCKILLRIGNTIFLSLGCFLGNHRRDKIHKIKMVKCTSLLKIRKSYLDKHVMLSKGLESKDNLLKRQKEAGTGK